MPRATMVAPLLACLLFTAGCSGSDAVTSKGSTPDASATGSASETKSPLAGLSAEKVWKQAKANVAQATSVHVIGRMKDGKDKIALNLKLTESGKAFGSIVVNGEKMTIRRLGKTLYFKADRQFWTTSADAATADALANKWIMVKKGSSSDIKEFFQLTDLDFILGETMTLTAASAKKLKLAPGIDIGEVSTVGLIDKGAKASKGEFETLYISDTDTALPMNFSMPTDDTQYMRFREWNETFKVAAPKGAIDLAAAGS